MKIIPIVVVAYNRTDSLKRLLKSLSLANYPDENIPLIISIDKGDNSDVLEYANNFEWKFGDKQVVYQKDNLGLKKHILQCGDYSEKFGATIILEDDIYVSREYYYYSISAVNFVRNDDHIAGVSLYNHRYNQTVSQPFSPLEDSYDNWYFQYASSWGQVWTKEQWQAFKNWYSENENYDFTSDPNIPSNVKTWGEKSWLKFYIMYMINTNKYFMYPRVALTTNFSDVGTNHMIEETTYQVPLCFINKNEYQFSTLDESVSVYDAHYENVKLADLMANSNDSICIDLYGGKHNYNNSRYLLSSKVLDYKVLRTYGCMLRPIEMNIIDEINGEDLFLYDLSCSVSNTINSKKVKQNRILYNLRGLTFENKMIIAKMFVVEGIQKVIKKIKLK